MSETLFRSRFLVNEVNLNVGNIMKAIKVEISNIDFYPSAM